VDWIHLAQDKVQWQIFVNMLMNLRRILIHGFSHYNDSHMKTGAEQSNRRVYWYALDYEKCPS
jgi:hypothetical protein